MNYYYSSQGGDGELFDLMNPHDEDEERHLMTKMKKKKKDEEILSSYHSPGSLADSKMPSSSLRQFSGLLEPHELAKVSQEKERDAYDVATVAEIDRTVKKYADNLLHALEGVSSRLLQLESRTRHLENSVDELKVSIGNNHGSTDGKIRQLENILREVEIGMQVLRDKQMIAEAQLQLSKLRASSSSNYKGGDHQPPPENSNTRLQQQDPAVQLPPQSPIPPRPSLPAPPNVPSQPPPYPAQFPPVQLSPQQPLLVQSVPSLQGQPADVATPQHYQMPAQQQHPSQQQHYHQPPPPQGPPHYSQPTQPANPSQPFQTSLPSHHHPEESAAPYMVPPPQPFAPPSSIRLPPPPQHYYGGSNPSGMYEPPSTNRQQLTLPTGYRPPPAVGPSFSEPSYTYNTGPPSPLYSNSSMKPPSSGSGGSNYAHLPTAQILPQAAAPTGSSSGGGTATGNRVPIDDVVDKVATMGFSREQVRATVRNLTENGQSVDLNVVLDKLMNGGGGEMIQPQKGWFGR